MNLKKMLAGLLVATCCGNIQAEVSTRLGFQSPSYELDSIDGPPIQTIATHGVGKGLETPIRFVSCEREVCDSGSCNQGCDHCQSCDGCDGVSGGGCDRGLLGYGIIKQSESCFDDFISPMTNPVYFEDPRQLTEARLIFINHKLPFLLNTPGGRIQLYALQARLRLTERLSFIAVKDGFVVSDSVFIDDGWADITAGLKYSLFRNAATGRMLSAGMRFETYSGNRRTLQGNGDGVFDFFLSGGSRLGTQSHFLTSAGFILPVDSTDENQMFYWSNHLDRQMAKKLYVFSELNWFNYMKDGAGLPIAGGDLFNFGAPGVAGKNIVTNAYGVKVKPNRNVEMGTAFEFPLTEFRGTLDNRLTADFILRF